VSKSDDSFPDNFIFKVKLTMKTILFMLVVVVVTPILLDVNASIPFEISETGVNIESYQLDTEMNSILLKVKVSDSQGTLEMTFDREFFDSIYKDQDDEFLVITDGELLAYEETKTTQSRTIILNLISDVDEVEIFGSHLMGQTIDENDITVLEIQEQNTQLLDEKELLTKQVSVLSTELEDTKVQKNILQEENEKLGEKIFEPDNLVKETKVQANNFSSAVMEQINAFTTWINSFF